MRKTITETDNCRRCTECVGMTHHWMPDMRDPEGDDFEPGDYGWKYCGVRGVECPDCGGEGVIDTGGSLPWGEWVGVGCEVCKAEGVVPMSDREISDAMHGSVLRYTQYIRDDELRQRPDHA